MSGLVESIDIEDIIKNESIVTFFQPIISVKKKSILGFESISMTKAPLTGDLVSREKLFEYAINEGLTKELYSLIWKKVLENFSAQGLPDTNFFLSLNIDPSIINGDYEFGLFKEIAGLFDIPPGKILLEIEESKIADVDTLSEFLKEFRTYGFLVGLSNVDMRFSSVSYITKLRPDILKIDKSAINKIKENLYNMDVAKSLVKIAHKIGSLVTAEGIQIEEEAAIGLDFGADMLQGSYFSMPLEHIEEALSGINEKIASLVKIQKARKIKTIKIKKEKHKNYSQIINTMVSDLSRIEDGLFDITLEKLIKYHPELECIYILDETGTQVSSTVFSPSRYGDADSFFFKPAEKGTDQSSKDYFFLIEAGLPKFTTEPYISLASRNECITISVAFRDVNYKKFIFCMDIVQNEMNDRLDSTVPAGL